MDLSIPAIRPSNWQQVTALVLDTLASPHSRRTYQIGLNDFRDWWEKQGRPPFVRATIQGYRAKLIDAGLAAATINGRLSVIRKLASEAAENGLLAFHAAAAIARIKGVRRLGVRRGNWLTLDQAQTLLVAPDPSSVKGKRDRAILALLLGCALRRSEIVAIAIDCLQQREGRWVIADMRGKGGRVRTVPIPAWAKPAVDAWTKAGQIAEGPLFRRVYRGGQVAELGLTEKVIWQVLQHYAKVAGLVGLAPHDLRRTCARLSRAAGGELEQIQYLLGHASVQTTERYLGTRQNLTRAPNDAIRLNPDVPCRPALP